MINTLLSFLPESLITEVKGLYEKNDKAHDFDHALGVCNFGNEIIGKFDDLKLYRRPILTACLMHDMLSTERREDHHSAGAQRALEMMEEHRVPMSNRERWLVYTAILEHRASWKHKRESKASEAVAAADRGPVDMHSYLSRAIKFRIAHPMAVNIGTWNLDQKKILVRQAIEHLHLKFGIGGYAITNLPYYTKLMFSNEIGEMGLALKTFMTGEEEILLNQGLDILHLQLAKGERHG